MAPVIREADRRKVKFFILHTGQHYDYLMDKVFFKNLSVPQPKYNLRVGSGAHGATTGKMLQGIEAILTREKPSAVFVQGDTNSVLAGTLAAAKLNIPVAHIEAGLRSYDRTMPEELNRIVADHLSDYLFAPTEETAKLAKSEGISKKKIFVTGNTIVDAVRILTPDLKAIFKKYGVRKNGYHLLTMHRPANVDNPKTLRELLAGIAAISDRMGLPCLFPAHPRTIANISAARIKVPGSIRILPPADYGDLLGLERGAAMVFTDSGGIQEESCVLGKKCLILRTNTERPETLKTGGAVLLKSLTAKSVISAFRMLEKRKIRWQNPFGDGHAAERIVRTMIAANKPS